MLTTKGNLRWLWLSIIVLIVDWVTKYYFNTHFWVDESTSVTSFLNFTLAYNRGAAFSFLNSQGGWQQWLFGVLAIVIVIGIIRWMQQLPKNKNWTAAALALVAGGAVGNLIDRVHYGYVIDFIDVHAGGWHWPVFNVADSAIVVGVIMLIAELFIRK